MRYTLPNTKTGQAILDENLVYTTSLLILLISLLFFKWLITLPQGLLRHLPCKML